MRVIFIVFLSSLASVLFAQTPIRESFKINSGQSLLLKFDYPQLIKMESWDGKELQITGQVRINHGKHDQKFEWKSTMQGNLLLVEGGIPDLKNIPQQVIAIDGKDSLRFNTEEEFQTYSKKHNRKFTTIHMGPDFAIELLIKVPKNVSTAIESVYGVVELKDFNAPLTVKAQYGGIDATLSPKTLGKLTVETNYGTIYSNLNLPFSGAGKENFHTLISTKVGTGPDQEFVSKFGNIYLRK